MSINNQVRISLSLLVGIIISCSQEKPTKSDEIVADVDQVVSTNFPNKRSELAILMRNLYNDIKAEKKSLENGEVTNVLWMEKYGSLLTASPTDDKHTGPNFEAFEKTFLQQLSAYEAANNDNRISLYNNLISSCRSCHEAHCPGPLMVIKKLPISNME